MADLLARMARSSAVRVAEARRGESEAALRRRAREARAPLAIRWSPQRFDLFAEVKRRAPSAGRLAGDDVPAASRAAAYAAAGAVVVSVLTEPSEFDGRLDDLREAAAAVAVPVLRKDFLVDPYQLFEARAAGASGALLVLRMLDDARLAEMLDAARECGLFLLLEAFDAADAGRARRVVEHDSEAERLIVGVNARDLETLEVDGRRLGRLAAALPSRLPRVAESGMRTSDDVRRAAALGYRAALVGSALMREPEPGALLRRMLGAGREEAARSCA